MINPAPFIKKVTSRGNGRIPIGDDYRYLYVLNRRDQTVTVIDVSTNTVTTTITLTASKTFTSLCYRPKDKTVWVFGTNSIDLIDANPSSGGFNTFANYTTTTGAGVCAIYDYTYDCFLHGSRIINAKTRAETTVNQFGTIYSDVFWHKSNIRFAANLSLITYSAFKFLSSKYLSAVVQPLFAATYNTEAVKIKDKFYAGISASFHEYSTKTGRILRNITVTQANTASLAYTPATRSIWVGSTVNGSTNLQVVSLSTFTVDSTETRTSPDTNESATRDILYCPYNGYVYAKGSNTSNPATGLGRVHYYNPGAVAGSRYVGYVSTGQDGSGSLYGRGTMCFNGAKIMEY